MTGTEIHVFAEAPDLAREAADLFVWMGRQAIDERKRFSVALSGGSTPRALYELLPGTTFSSQLDWGRVEFYFGDERGVPPEHPESNYKMAYETLFRPLNLKPDQIFRMVGEVPDPARAAHEYETVLRNRFAMPAPAWPCFDLILLGMGEDGHTASLFPHTPALLEQERLVVANQAPRGIRNRLTFTAPLINHARLVLFLVSGESKASAARAVLEGGNQDPSQFPAKLIKPAQGRLLWFLDHAAAAQLSQTTQQIESHEE
jgi:6-phosphogluconolactonase